MQETLQQWDKEKAEREQEHEKVLFEMRQKVATLQAQRQEEQTRFENAKREVLLEKQKEKNSLSETLLQTRGQLSQACQQVQQLRQEVKEQQEKGQVSLSRQGTECRAVVRAQKAGAGSEEARAASGPGSTEPGKLQSSGPGRKACNGSRAG